MKKRLSKVRDARSAIAYEHDLAHRWQRLPIPITLPLINGDACQLLHAGRPGGPQGPDMRDAVVAFAPGKRGEQGGRAGDIEFHIRCSDWYTHQHHTDPRYNNVILHVVLVFDLAQPITRQDGQSIPVCSLLDLVPATMPVTLPATSQVTSPETALQDQPATLARPCESIMPELSKDERDDLLHHAGLQRFEQKTQALLAQLRELRPSGPFCSFSAYDTCLIPALAEALGFGRDRAFFRAAGLRLIGLPAGVPEPLGRSPAPPKLDAGRLRMLGELVEQWRGEGAWESARQMLMSNAALSALRGMFGAIGHARADILICNVMLPFAAAVAQLENDQPLSERALHLYNDYPALASNQVTRAMRLQLQLEREPRQACALQGLQHIYAHTCREKRCDDCLVTHWRKAT